jgi:hypothetical protein
MLKYIRCFTAVVLSGAVLLLPSVAMASTYGSGNYGACQYSTGCSGTSGGSNILMFLLIGFFAFLIVLALLLLLLLWRRRLAILAQDASSSVTTIKVLARSRRFSETPGYNIKIDSEILSVLKVSGEYPNYTVKVSRGANNTSKLGHQKDQAIYKSK